MEDQKENTERSKIHADFEALPLDEKIASLLKMEMLTISETFAYAMESPLKVVEKVGDIITDLGEKIENKAKEAQEKTEAKKTAPKPAGGPKTASKGPRPKGTQK